MALMQHIEMLKKRHYEIDRMIHEENTRALPDEFRLHDLKRKKLHVKDDISRLLQEAA
jgi:hypothetical protein